MAKATDTETVLSRLLHHAAKQGVVISKELRTLIVKATDEVAALDRRLIGKPKTKRKPAPALAAPKPATKGKKTVAKKTRTGSAAKAKRTRAKSRKTPAAQS
jgi:predicted house-cleaning NTP pyrophosphatase (Maf/HAM1 superfamily)